MSAKLVIFFFFLALAVCQQLISGEQNLQNFEKNVGKGFHSSGRHVDEPPEFETEKGLLIRQKRDAVAGNDTSTADPATSEAPKTSGAPKKLKKRMRSRKNGTMSSSKNRTVSAQSLKRVAGFTKIFLGMSGGLIFLAIAHVAFFIWFMIALKKVKKP